MRGQAKKNTKNFPVEIYYSFVAFDALGNNVRAFVLLNFKDNATHSLKFEEIWQKSNSRGS